MQLSCGGQHLKSMLVRRANVRAVGTLAGTDTQAREKTSEEQTALHQLLRLVT